MFLKKLFTHSLIYALGPQLPRVASIIILPLITQFLTPGDYGIYGVTMSYAALFTAAGDLGFSILMVNSYYKYPVHWPFIWRQLHFYLMVWCLIYSLVLGLCLNFILPPEVGANLFPIIMLVCLPIILFNSTIMMGAQYFQYAQKPLFASTGLAVVGMTTILLNLYTIVWLKMGYMGWFVSTAMATFIQFLFYSYPVWFQYGLRPIIAFRKNFLSKQLRVSLPTIPHNYSSYLLNSSDRIVMDRLNIKVSDIGQYSVAYTFGNYFDIAGNAIGMALGPLYMSLLSKKNLKSATDLFFITNWLQVSFIVGGFIIALWCRELMQILFRNNELNQVYPLAIIIVMGYVYRPYYWACVNQLQFTEKTSQLWRISFIAGILNVGLNLLLIPFFGIMAAAVTTFVALLYMGFSGHFLKSFRESEPVKYYPIQMIAVILAVTAMAYGLKEATVIIKLIITIGWFASYLIYTWSRIKKFNSIEL